LPYGGVAQRLSQRNKIPLGITEHYSRIAQKNLSQDELLAIKKIGSKAGGVAAVGKELQISLSEVLDREDIQLLPNAIDTDFFISSSTQQVDSRLRLTVIGSLYKIKRVDLLLTAMKQVLAIYPNTQLNIGGNGPERTNLEFLAKTLQIENNVIFYGRLNRSEVRELYRETDVVVSSSDTETFGVTLIEAMSCGLPVISTRSGGPEGIVTKQTGILVERNNLKSLVDGILEMYENYKLYDHKVIRSYAVNHFGRKSLIANLGVFYRKFSSSSEEGDLK